MRNPIKTTLLLLLSMLLAGMSAQTSERTGAKVNTVTSPADYVNPFIGTDGPDMGNTYPGAALPFGMIQWSPETAVGFVKYDGSYRYPDTEIREFSLTHLSGPGCPIMGDVPIMPSVGAIASSPAADPTARPAPLTTPSAQRGITRTRTTTLPTI